jgi:hypothetical protein
MLKKVKLSLCLIEYHDMKAYGGDLELGHYHDTSVLPLWKASQIALVRRLDGPGAGLDALAMQVALVGKQTPVL